MFNEFVIIDRPDVQKYNEVPKLVEEQKFIESGSSSCVVSRPGSSKDNHKYTLEDFQIKKVIDKGSFGKVFLVVNKINGKLYAMKRINKDVLIDKN